MHFIHYNKLWGQIHVLKNIEKIRKAPNAWEPSKQIQRESKSLTKKYCNHK